MKELMQYENTLREENSKETKPLLETADNESQVSEDLDTGFKTELISFMDAEPYRRVENNSEIQEILLKKPDH